MARRVDSHSEIRLWISAKLGKMPSQHPLCELVRRDMGFAEFFVRQMQTRCGLE